MTYFYTMQQLDLFGMPVQPVATPAKKTAAAKEKPVPLTTPVIEPTPVVAEPAPEPLPIPEPVAEIPVLVEEKKEVPADPVVFADERIVVKLKAKPAIVPDPEPIVEQTVPAIVNTAPATKQPGKRGRKSFREIDTEIDLVDIPDEEILKQKLYYPISEVAKWFKVNTSLLRYWENEFDILQPRKTRKGDRLFRVEDIRNLQLIYFLLRQRKFSIEGARNYLKQNKHQADTQVQLVQSLTKFKSFLLELRAGLGN